MLRVLAAVPYTPQPCRVNCKPSPDGSPATGWMLVVFGAMAIVAGFVVLLRVPRPDPEPEGEQDPKPTPVMDAVQRQDLEQRAERERSDNQSLVNIGGGLAVAGVAAIALGVVLINSTLSAINESKKELRDNASLVASQATYGSGSSPRSTVRNQLFEPIGLLQVERVFSTGFDDNGEITVHDKVNDRSLCVRIPASVSGGFDPDSAISSGACPDAPPAPASGR